MRPRPPPPLGFALLASLAESLTNFRGPLIELLQERGFRVSACAPPTSLAVRAQLERAGVEFTAVELRRNRLGVLGDLAYAARLYAWLRRTRPQFVLAYTAKPVIYGLLAARAAGVPVRSALITGLGYALTGESLGRRALRWLLIRLHRVALRKAACVMFQNPDDQAFFAARAIVPAGVPTAVMNGSGVDLRRFQPCALPGAPTFLLIARLLRDKGIGEYAAAARLVKAQYPQARFRLAGWHDTNPEAIEAAALQGWIAAGLIEYLGPLEDVRPALAECRIYVLPSYREGTPRTVLEAMAMGRPVITTDVPGCRETVQPEVNGLLVPAREAAPLAAAMIRMLADPELAERCGREGLRIAREKYDARRVSTAMLAAMGMDRIATSSHVGGRRHGELPD